MEEAINASKEADKEKNEGTLAIDLGNSNTIAVFQGEKDKNPRWDCVRLKYLFEFNRMLTLKELADKYSSEELKILQKGNRLSIVPVNEKLAEQILKNLGKAI